MTRRMLLRWGALLLVVAVLAVVFVQLGEWQLRRLDERRATNARVLEHSQQQPQPYAQVMDEVIDDEDQWYPVTVTGTYTGETYQARYRNQDGAGTEVVSVLEADDGRLVLIDRGFIPRPQGQPDPAPPAPPTGEVTVQGYVHRNERGRDNAITPHEFNIRLINSEAIGASLGEELVDGYITAQSSVPEDDPLLVPVALPSLDEGPHLSYAWQWFSFTLIAVIGVVVLIRADIRDRRKAERRRARLAQRREAEEAIAQPADT